MIKLTPNLEFAYRITQLRKGLGLTQADMAGILNVSQAAVNRYEHGFSEAPFAVLVSLADYYDVSLDYLFGRTENPQGKKFNHEPAEFRDMLKNKKEWEKFINACFEPGSPFNTQLKNALMQMRNKKSEE